MTANYLLLLVILTIIEYDGLNKAIVLSQYELFLALLNL